MLFSKVLFTLLLSPFHLTDVSTAYSRRTHVKEIRFPVDNRMAYFMWEPLPCFNFGFCSPCSLCSLLSVFCHHIMTHLKTIMTYSLVLEYLFISTYNIVILKWNAVNWVLSKCLSVSWKWSQIRDSSLQQCG
jgi:hypothetical protein